MVQEESDIVNKPHAKSYHSPCIVMPATGKLLRIGSHFFFHVDVPFYSDKKKKYIMFTTLLLLIERVNKYLDTFFKHNSSTLLNYTHTMSSNCICKYKPKKVGKTNKFINCIKNKWEYCLCVLGYIKILDTV